MSNPVNGSGGGLQQVLALRQQIVERSDALRSLKEAGATDGQPAVAPAKEGGFADTLRSAVDSVNATQQKSSAMTEAYERGEVTDIAQVMLARQESGVAFEATLQVRNKLLTAYQEIMRMGV